MCVGWLVAIAFCLSAVYGAYGWDDENCEQPCNPWPEGLEYVYNVYIRDMFALGIAWLMFACCAGYGGNSIARIVNNTIVSVFHS